MAWMLSWKLVSQTVLLEDGFLEESGVNFWKGGGVCFWKRVVYVLEVGAVG